MKRFISVTLLAAFLGGCSFVPKSILDNPDFATAVGKAANATNNAATKANEALDKICDNYVTVHLGFQGVVAVAALIGKNVPQSVVDSESDAMSYVDSVCTNRPADAQEALVATQKAYATIVSIAKRFKST